MFKRVSGEGEFEIRMSASGILFTQQAVDSLTQSADSALAKINIALPASDRARSEALTRIIGFVAPKAVRWGREQQHYGHQSNEEQTPEGTTMLHHVNHEADIIPWVLGSGSSA